MAGFPPDAPETQLLVDHFSGSTKQFYLGQSRLHALGNTMQTNKRVDRGDHQLEYLEQFGTEIITLHVHPEKAKEIIQRGKAFEFLDIRVQQGPEADEAGVAFNTLFIARELYNPDTPESIVGSVTYLPAGVSYSQEYSGDYVPRSPTLFWTEPFAIQPDDILPDEAYDPDTGEIIDDHLRYAHAATRNYLDLRQFHPESVVSVEIWLLQTYAVGVSHVVGIKGQANAHWAYGTPAPDVPSEVEIFRDIATGLWPPGVSASIFTSYFPEYSTLFIDAEGSSSQIADMTVPRLIAASNMMTWDEDTGNYHPDNVDEWPGIVTWEPGPTYVEFWPGTSVMRKYVYEAFLNDTTGDATKPTIPPSVPSWEIVNPGIDQTYETLWSAFLNHICFIPETELVTTPIAVGFDVEASCHMGGALPYYTRLSRLASNRTVASRYGNDPFPRTLANKYNSELLGTVFADRKTGAVSFQRAASSEIDEEA